MQNTFLMYNAKQCGHCYVLPGMGQRQRDWARRAYDKLIVELGGVCIQCGSTEELTIDHKQGCTYKHEQLEWSSRVSKYRKEAKEGKLQVLCNKCNCKKGRPEDAEERPDDDGMSDLYAPFQPVGGIHGDEPF